MPVIAQIMIPVRFGEDGLVEILKQEVNRCGCLDLVTESKRLNTPVDRLLKVMSSINGVVCDDAGMCCATDVSRFADKLKKFQED
jgi:hypothetical protein